ncbi:unannotated protein [freshwater metagenome]|uniref:Unannotated protein n=1 Tax=freshwater metagenome TaxID=449393 RepID=A0A6J7HEX4_9ZZZZ
MRFVENGDRLGLQLAVGTEVAAGGDAIAVDVDQPSSETARARLGPGVEGGRNIPVLGTAERHPLALTLDDDAGGHGLHTACRQLRHDLLPQHRADLVAVETVEDAAGFLCVDEVLVQVASIGGGREDRRLGDLVEDHASNGDFGVQGLEEMPGDGLTLAVGVSGEIQLVGVLEQAFELCDLALLLG